MFRFTRKSSSGSYNNTNQLFELASIPRALVNSLNTVYPHTVHETHALQGKSYSIPLLSYMFLIVQIFYLHTPYISFYYRHNMQP